MNPPFLHHILYAVNIIRVLATNYTIPTTTEHGTYMVAAISSPLYSRKFVLKNFRYMIGRAIFPRIRQLKKGSREDSHG